MALGHISSIPWSVTDFLKVILFIISPLLWAVNSQFPRRRYTNLCCDWSITKILVLWLAVWSPDQWLTKSRNAILLPSRQRTHSWGACVLTLARPLVGPSVCLSVGPSVCSSVDLSVCWSVSLSVNPMWCFLGAMCREKGLKWRHFL